MNRAGRYSWDGRKSWMHNPHDHDIGVSIIFSALANHYESGPTAITVAGYDGTYQELSTGTDGVRTERLVSGHRWHESHLHRRGATWYDRGRTGGGPRHP